MNTNNIKKYAPIARRDFIEAVGKRLNQFGVYNKGNTLTISEPTVSGSVMQIDGNAFDAGLAPARKRLTIRAEQLGFAALVEQAAYTWFNRLCAIRFMELKPDYLEHGFRVLSHPEKTNSFEILDHAQDVAEALGLERNHIVELKLAGNKDEALYRDLLLGQCHQLHQAMPFLFEALDDETELLLPDNLTRTDSILRGLVDGIPEEDWEQVEIIGWLYQFYISEKKDQVIGKVVKSEDIPAATQLFTPNWIVKYLVQNSVGRQWMMTYPDSGLKAQMDYYITPAEQEAAVGVALAAITPTSIEPETIKVIDPACGSGHILVEAYNLLKAIYEERGYRSRDIPKLILENNLYGLDIDDRAAQLAGFALMMKAREDDRRIFTRDIKLNVLALQATHGLDLPELWRKLDLNNVMQVGTTESIFYDAQSSLIEVVDDVDYTALESVLVLFEHAKTFGSLIQVPHDQSEFLCDLKNQLEPLIEQGDNFKKMAATVLLPFVQQAWLLAQRYDAVIANPPYMGRKGMFPELKPFLNTFYPNCIWDLYAAFIEQCIQLTKQNGSTCLITMQSWMSLPAYEQLRVSLLSTSLIDSLVHLGARAFDSISGEVVRTVAFSLKKAVINGFKGHYLDLREGKSESEKTSLWNKPTLHYCLIIQDNFFKLPGTPVCYWVNQGVLNCYQVQKRIASYAISQSLNLTGDNERFLRFFWELNSKKIGLNKDWLFYAKGGKLRKWYGNFDYVVAWDENTRNFLKKNKTARLIDEEHWYKEGITWSMITSGKPGFRILPKDAMFDVGGASIIFDEIHISEIMCFLNSSVAEMLIRLFNETKIQLGNVTSLPFIQSDFNFSEKYNELVLLHKEDWDESELSFNFKQFPLIPKNSAGHLSRKAIHGILQSEKTCYTPPMLDIAYLHWQTNNNTTIAEIQRLEQENNRFFIDTYCLQDELDADVPLEQITLTVNPKYRYGGNLNDEQLAQRFQADTLAELISYAIGCMMGRYSLDEPCLIYAHEGNTDFDPARYQTFTADEDGIIPLTDQDWFKDDATNRFRDFVRTVWGEENLQANLSFVAESLCLGSLTAKRGEQSLETIRRYLSNQFYKDHLQTYKKRPIYWLFSSGKQKAFEGLVYLHRYNDSTLPRMRTEYVTPLLGKYDAFADQLKKQLEDATTSEATLLKKELLALEKKQTELRAFDDNLKHYADRRIKLDLDDGVKVNYGMFGDLLAEVKAVTGSKE